MRIKPVDIKLATIKPILQNWVLNTKTRESSPPRPRKSPSRRYGGVYRSRAPLEPPYSFVGVGFWGNGSGVWLRREHTPVTEPESKTKLCHQFG